MLRSFLNLPGDIPVSFLKTILKEEKELNPTSSPIANVVFQGNSINNSFAFLIR